MDPLKLSIIIVSWNTHDLLKACLDSIYAYPPQDPFEVWVVDNASTDGSPAMVRENFPQVRLVENTENVGFAGGNNQAIRQSTGEYVLLLNPDTEVRPEALDSLVQFMDARPDVGAAGSRLIDPDGSLQTSCSPSPTLLREFLRLFHVPGIPSDGTYDMHAWSLDVPRPVDVIQGASLIVRRSVLDQVGLLDETYFIYSEEVDLCLRIQRAGWRLYWVPRSQVVHYGGQSTRQVAAEMFLRLYQGKVLYFRKHYGRGTVMAYKAILTAAAVSRMALSPLALLGNPAKRRQNRMLSSHYRRLLIALPGM